MAVDGDVENQTSTMADEQTPLLNDRHSGDVDDDQRPVDEEEDVHEKKKKPSWYLWRIFWAIIVILMLAIFIKGWIDAGSDVNVRDDSTLHAF